MPELSHDQPVRCGILRRAVAAAAMVSLFACGSHVLERAVGQSPGADPAASPRMRSTDRAPRERSGKARYREGAQIASRVGQILVEGDSATFVMSDGVKMGVLENLNLERIIRTLKTASQPDQVEWTVSGMVTEYGGQNYLLVSRAVYKAASPSP